MTGRKVSFFFALSAVLVLVAACGEDTAPPAGGGGKPVVYTTFYPTTYFTERIVGDLAEVVCPLPEGADPIFWLPEAEQVLAYQGADLVVVNGADFEKWVGKVSLREDRVVDTAKGFEADFLLFENVTTHSHGPSGEHTHKGVDGHTWLDPIHAKAQAAAILAALTRLLPDHEKELRTRFDALAADLMGLNAALEALKASYRGESILASHPAYNYLAKRYDLSIQNLDLDPEAPPDEQPLAEIRAAAEMSGARFLLWESAPAAGVAEKIASETGLESVVFSPCELPSAADIAGEGDYLAMMKANIEKLRPVLRPAD